tara:strand:+ start:5645 stop:6241 length:597 start_codon:yes stop_codon:yes gene_type:complete
MTGVATTQNRIIGTLEPGMCLTADELSERLPEIDRGEIIKSVGRMCSHSICERVERGCYRLTAKGADVKAGGKPLTSGPRGPHTRKIRKSRKVTFRQRCWNAIRIKGKFTRDDVAMMAATGSERDPYSNALKYISALEKAGYLRRLPKETGIAPTSNGFVRWALFDHMNSGPDAPIIRTKDGGIYDPNRDEVLGGANG